MQNVYINENFFYCVYKCKSRTIFAPCKELKKIQKIILELIKLDFKIKLSQKDAASVHRHQKYLLKLDIKDFYGSVPKELIKETINKIYAKFPFSQSRWLRKKYIYEMCTINDKLPQGAVTSPYLANIAFEITGIDDKIIDFCLKEKINYSRYMDDLFFSCSEKTKLNAVEKLVKDLLKEYGFELNTDKTKYISDNKPQEVLGLVVNNREDVVISSKNKNNYRAMFFNYLKSIYIEERLGVQSLFLKRINYSKIQGYLAYIKSSDYKYYVTIVNFLKSKINKFGICNNKEIKKLRRTLK